MIITRTPFRLSFLGGGTDFPFFYNNQPGKVLSVALDKYCYLTCRFLPPFFRHRHRIVYSIIEMVNQLEEITHPVVRKVFEHLGVTAGIELHHDGDLPAWSGLGSSSSFTVGLIHAVLCLQDREVTKDNLARMAVEIERVHLRENVGSQDQYAAAHGGLNVIKFHAGDSVEVNRIEMSTAGLRELENSVLLVFSGRSRHSSEISSAVMKEGHLREENLKRMLPIVDLGIAELTRPNPDLKTFGGLITESWQLKKSLSSIISNPTTDEIISIGLNNGAYGAKVMGAGGGGFVAFIVERERKNWLKQKFPHNVVVDVGFDHEGSKLLFRK